MALTPGIDEATFREDRSRDRFSHTRLAASLEKMAEVYRVRALRLAEDLGALHYSISKDGRVDCSASLNSRMCLLQSLIDKALQNENMLATTAAQLRQQEEEVVAMGNEGMLATSIGRRLGGVRVQWEGWATSSKEPAMAESVSDAPTCVVCFDEVDAASPSQRLGCCGKEFHEACISLWLRTGSASCPLCRAHLESQRAAKCLTGTPLRRQARSTRELYSV
eukprot:TRINITY_DN83216_c0_g1_i1.p1 TRINITY_DN83216_c0_g1~~TRINITY_DN83216_c0_g1_i1.p1  ORF type:complete len:222 (-),score=26.16 TRINITY_DN83216_c0_g1_i1:283-948(-)